MGFLRKVEGMTDKNLEVDTWKKEGADRVIQAIGTKPLREYIERRQATVAEWVALQTIFEVFAKYTGFEGGGRVRGKWWRQTSAERKLKATLKEISAAAWERRQREYGRRGEGEGGAEESEYGGVG